MCAKVAAGKVNQKLKESPCPYVCTLFVDKLNENRLYATLNALKCKEKNCAADSI